MPRSPRRVINFIEHLVEAAEGRSGVDSYHGSDVSMKFTWRSSQSKDDVSRKTVVPAFSIDRLGSPGQ